MTDANPALVNQAPTGLGPADFDRGEIEAVSLAILAISLAGEGSARANARRLARVAITAIDKARSET